MWLIIFVLIFVLIYHYRNAVSKQIFSICNDYSYSVCSESVNKAVLMTLNGVNYEDLVNITRNNVGDIVLMSTDSIKVNNINKNISINTENNIKEKLDKGVNIPLFAFIGIPLLSGYGKGVNFNSMTISSTVSKFRSEFSSCGINQTLHSIYIDVTSEVITEIPFNRQKNTCLTEVLVLETVLVGKVPEIYLNGGLFANS